MHKNFPIQSNNDKITVNVSHTQEKLKQKNNDKNNNKIKYDMISQNFASKYTTWYEL